MLLEVMAKIKDTIGASEEDKIRTDQESKRLALAEKSEKIKESEDKLAEATEKRGKLSTWDKVKIAFQYIGAIASIVAGVLALATSIATGPAGIVSGALLIGAGILLLGMAADATYVAVNTEKNGQPSLGFIGEANKAVLMDQGMSEEEATKAGHKADTIARIVVAVVAGAMMIGAAIAGGVSAYQLGFAVYNAIQGSTGIATNTIAVASTAASASGDIASAVGKKDATDLEADAKRLEGASKAMQAIVAFLDDMIDIALTRLKGVHQTFEGMLDTLVESANDSAASYARVGLRG
ncbi:type III secretion system translocon subunit SctE [uncultured Methylobacterium sp.]|uniref:type III secretion system translocon subunit SctE n=1 Tax=uncultured Methylobacterium sp. TaxID=157278 RepID=UPI0035C9CAA1